MVEHRLDGPVGNAFARFARWRRPVGESRTRQAFLLAKSKSGEQEYGEGDTGEQDGG